MSDPLAEAICQAAFDRHVLIDRTDCAALAAAARAHIGGEIKDKYKAEHRRYPGWDGGYFYGLSTAAKIARGDTE